MAKDLVKRPFIWLGMLGFVFMLPLALTSFNAAVRWLGGKRWQQLHRLVYVLPVFALLHFYWMRAGKNDFDEVWIYAQNNHTSDVALRLGFGGVTDPDDIVEFTVKTKAGLYLIVPGLVLKGNASALTIKASAGTANVISLSGYVNRITA